jgi:hypothetical protein
MEKVSKAERNKLREHVSAMFAPVDESQPGYTTARRLAALYQLTDKIVDLLLDYRPSDVIKLPLDEDWIRVLQRENFTLYTRPVDSPGVTWIVAPSHSLASQQKDFAEFTRVPTVQDDREMSKTNEHPTLPTYLDYLDTESPLLRNLDGVY